LKLKYDDPLLFYFFNFNLRHYNVDPAAVQITEVVDRYYDWPARRRGLLQAPEPCTVGRCRLNR